MTGISKAKNEIKTNFPLTWAIFTQESKRVAEDKKPGSSVRVEAQCHICRHRWIRRIGRLVDDPSCPCCTMRELVVGKNDLETTHPELSSLVTLESLIRPGEVTYRSATKKLSIVCRGCTKIRLSTPQDFTEFCSDCYRFNRKDLGERSLAFKRPDLIQYIAPGSKVDPKTVTEFSSEKIAFLCSFGHEWTTKVLNVSSRKVPIVCPVHRNKVLVAGVNDVATTHPEVAKLFSSSSPLGPDQITAGSGALVVFECSRNHIWSTTVVNVRNSLDRGFGACAKCHRQSKRSKLEEEVASWIEGLGHLVVPNDTSILGSLEVDIYLPGVRKAIEVNGEYWHSDNTFNLARQKPSERHQMKINMLRKEKIELAFVWEDDWKNNRLVTQDRISVWLSGGPRHPALRRTKSILDN